MFDTGTTENRLLVPAVTCDCARFGVLRRPVFRGKGHAPKCWPRCCKLQADLRLAAANRAEERHMALLFLFCFVVLHVYHGAADEARGEQYQASVGIDRKSLRVFLEVLALRILAANA